MTMITVTFTGEQADGTFSTGTITALLSETITVGTVTVNPTDIVGVVNEDNGQLKTEAGQPFTLMANTGNGDYYSFTLQLDDTPLEQFNAVVPATAPGATIDISTLRSDPGLA
jgi:hypothetical protein